MKSLISLLDDLVAYLDQKVDNRSHIIEILLKQWCKQQEAEAIAQCSIEHKNQ